jgi:CheY-like chemotaxis protein
VVEVGRILIAEENANDVELTIEAFAEYNLSNDLVVARDGVEALDYLHCRGRYSARQLGNPAVVFLDLKMPKVDGLDLLKQVKSDLALRTISGADLIPRGERHSGQLRPWR